jgi:hypothetical protein
MKLTGFDFGNFIKVTKLISERLFHNPRVGLRCKLHKSISFAQSGCTVFMVRKVEKSRQFFIFETETVEQVGAVILVHNEDDIDKIYWVEIGEKPIVLWDGVSMIDIDRVVSQYVMYLLVALDFGVSDND